MNKKQSCCIYCNSSFFSLHIGQLFSAITANILAVVADHTVRRIAEDTGRLKLLEYDFVTIHVDFQLIPLRNILRASNLDGQHNSTQLVHLTNDTR